LGKLLLLGATVSALGCSEKDAAKCQDALDGTRKSVAAADQKLIGEWRERAYKYCADTASLSALDKQIVDQTAAAAATAAAEAQRKAQNEGLLKTFTTWAGDNRVAPDHASAAPKCDGDDPTAATPKVESTDPKAKERFCTATRAAGTTALTARYWEADKTIVLFTVTPPGPVSCDDIGPNKVLKSWDVPATNGQGAKRTRCELTTGALSGLNVVVSAANNAAVYVFSPTFLTKDAAMKKIAGE
jgi:hypothetical protein